MDSNTVDRADPNVVRVSSWRLLEDGDMVISFVDDAGERIEVKGSEDYVITTYVRLTTKRTD